MDRFGWGLAIGGDASVLGWGSTFSFEYFPAPWLALGSRLSFSIGFLDEPYTDADGGPSGFGFLLTHQVGVRFVLDFEFMGPMRWFRPFFAFYPLGFAYLNGGAEIEEPDGRFNSVAIEDVFFIISGGFGLDLFVTAHFGLGFAVYIYNTVGGSTHREPGRQYRTDGGQGFIVDLVRFSVRF